jgi:hypothetical protein
MAASAWTPVDESVSAWKPVAEATSASSTQPGFLDREIPLTSHTAATESGLQSIGRGVRDAVKGTWNQIAQPPQDDAEKAIGAIGPAALPLYRTLRGIGHTAQDALQMVGAVHDINESADPLGTYAKAAQEIAGQGAGQALTALATEGAAKAAPAIADTLGSSTKMTAPIRTAVRATNKVLEKAPGSIGASVGAGVGHATGIPGAAEVGGAAGYALGKELLPQVKIPGEHFGLPDSVEGGPESAPEYQPPAVAPAKAAAPPAAAPPAAAPQSTATPAAVEKQLNDALGGKPLQPGVSLRNQGKVPAAASLPEGFTPVESSSVLKGYKYDPASQQFDAITNNGQRFRHGEVTPDQFKAFEDADSKGKAWNDLRNGPGVTPLGKVDANGVLQARKPIAARSVVVDPETGKPEFSDVLAAKQNAAPPAAEPKAAAAAAGAGGEDLTSLLQQSLDQVKVPKGGVQASAAPGDLMKRWGVDESSIADTDRNLRGMNEAQSQQYIDKLAASYKNGRAVEPVLETRDAENNIVSVDGRHRAIAAQKAGIDRIPVIVRRMPKVETTQ